MSGGRSYIEHFRARVLQDALAEATSRYWRRRAQQLRDAVTPRPGDLPGIAPDAEERRQQRRRRMLSTAAAMEAKATVFGPGEPPLPEVWAALDEADQAAEDGVA